MSRELPVVTIAGSIYLSPQLLSEVAKWNCKEASDMRYAFTGERSACICGQHVSPVPLAPLFDETSADNRSVR